MHEPLARFQRLLKEAGLIFSVRSSTEPRASHGGGENIADMAMMRARKIKDYQIALSDMGPQNHRLLLAVLTQDWPLARTGSVVLERAAEILAHEFET